MNKVALALVLLLLAALVFGCASTSSPTPSKPATSTPPAATTTTTAPPSTSAPPASSSAPASSASSTEPIKVGAIISTTGEGQLAGPSAKACLELRTDLIGGQIAGRKIQLIMEDDGTDPTTAVDKARKLVQSDKVDVVLGPVGGATGPAVANFMKNMGIPNLLWAPKSAGLLKLGTNNIYLTFGTEANDGYQIGTYAFNNAKYKTAVTIFEDFTAGQNNIGGAAKAFEKLGGTVIQSIPVKQGTVDFAPFVTSMKNADCVIFFFTPPMAARFLPQYFSSGLKMPLMVTGASTLTPKMLTQFGDKLAGMVGAGTWSNLIDLPANKDYIAAFSKKYDPGILIEQGMAGEVSYDMFLAAVKSTNGDTTPAKVNDALHKVKADTPAGTYSFNADGLAVGDLYIFEVVKLPNGTYDYGVKFKYPQIPLDAPAQ
jgi:branched-chain amino acid transport system substrate-binding protein